MADLSVQKYDVYEIPDLEVTIARYYVEDSPDSVGTIEEIEKCVRDHFKKMPFKLLWQGSRFEFWDKRSPDLISSRNVTLLDYDLHKEGNQTAAGLYFSADSKRVALLVNNELHRINGLTPVEFALDTFSHEFGHLYGDLCGFFERGSKIEELLTDLFNDIRPRQTANPSEDFAETYRALRGGPSTIGTFSDGKEANLSDELDTLVRCAYWLSGNLRNESGLESLELFPRWCTYTIRTEYPWYYFKAPTRTAYALTNNWDKFVWKDGWVAA